MAKSKDNIVTKGMGGVIGDNLFRTFKSGTYVGKRPDMSNVIPSKNQTKKRKQFAKAVEFAVSAMKDPAKSAAYTVEPDHSLYHTIIREYMKSQALEPGTVPFLSEETKIRFKVDSLQEAQLRAITYISEYSKITNKIYQNMNGVSKPTATRHLHELVSLNIIKSNMGKGAGASYTIGSAWENRLINS
jgi:predicted HTH transcriptional regulator